MASPNGLDADSPAEPKFANLFEHEAGDTEKLRSHRRSVFADLEEHKIEDDDDEDAEAEEIISIRVRRPAKKDFIRAHRTYQFTAYIIEDEDETYYVAPSMRQLLKDEDVPMRKVVLVPYINKRRSIFLWAITTTEIEDWHATAMKAVQVARERWIRIASKKETTSYIYRVAKRDYGEPEWPALSLNEMLDLAFGNRYVDSPNHAAVSDTLYG